MMQRNEIEAAAERVLSEYHIRDNPFAHIKGICDREAITIKRTTFSQSMDGAFAVILGQKFIFYNDTKSEARANFTKAHELGHYFLKHPLTEGSMISCESVAEDENGSGKLPSIETEANYFAAAFLMPRELVNREYTAIRQFLRITPGCRQYVDRQACNMKDWNLVCNHLRPLFGVSAEALGYRLQRLGKIIYNL